MFDEKTILTRLQDGEELQKILDEFITSANAANSKYEKEKAKAEAEAKAKAEEEKRLKKEELQKKTETKIADLQSILDQFHVWLSTYYPSTDPETLKEFFTELDAKTVIDLLEMAEKYVKTFSFLEDSFTPFFSRKPSIIKKATTSSPDPLADFIKSTGW